MEKTIHGANRPSHDEMNMQQKAIVFRLLGRQPQYGLADTAKTRSGHDTADMIVRADHGRRVPNVASTRPSTERK